MLNSCLIILDMLFLATSRWRLETKSLQCRPTCWKWSDTWRRFTVTVFDRLCVFLILWLRFLQPNFSTLWLVDSSKDALKNIFYVTMIACSPLFSITAFYYFFALVFGSFIASVQFASTHGLERTILCWMLEEKLLSEYYSTSFFI